MLFEPEILISLAKRANLTLTRRDEAMLVYGVLSADWEAILVQHKTVLLPLLPDDPGPSKTQYGLKELPKPYFLNSGQFDLFGYPDGLIPTPKRKRSKTKVTATTNLT